MGRLSDDTHDEGNDIVNTMIPSRIQMLQTPTMMSNVVKCIGNNDEWRGGRIRNIVVTKIKYGGKDDDTRLDDDDDEGISDSIVIDQCFPRDNDSNDDNISNLIGWVHLEDGDDVEINPKGRAVYDRTDRYLKK